MDIQHDNHICNRCDIVAKIHSVDIRSNIDVHSVQLAYMYFLTLHICDPPLSWMHSADTIL